MTTSVTNPEELGRLAPRMRSDCGHLALQGRTAAATAEPEELCSFETSLFPVHGGTNMVCGERSTLAFDIDLSVLETGFQIKTRVQELGHGCFFLVRKTGALQICPADSCTKRELTECARAVTEKVFVTTNTPCFSHTRTSRLMLKGGKETTPDI